MKINPLFARYLKAALIIATFFFLILSIDFLSSEQHLKKTIEIVYKDDLSNNYNDSTAFNKISYEKDGSVMDVYWTFESAVNLDRKKTLVSSLIMICIFLMFLYYEERNKKTANFIYSLPIKKEKIFFYKWISGFIMFLFLFTLLSILIFGVYSKYTNVILKYISQLHRDIPYVNKGFITFWINELLHPVSYWFTFSVLLFTYMNLFQTLFGKPIIALAVSILSLLGIINIFRGLSGFFDFYEINFSIDKIFNILIRIISRYYTMIFEIIILFLIGMILYKKNDFEKNDNIFVFKKVKLLLYIGVFLCGGPFVFRLSKYFNLLSLNDILTGTIILICGSVFSTLILNKIIVINE